MTLIDFLENVAFQYNSVISIQFTTSKFAICNFSADSDIEVFTAEDGILYPYLDTNIDCIGAESESHIVIWLIA